MKEQQKRDVCSKENDDRAGCGIDRGNCLPVFERKFDCIWKREYLELDQ